MYSAIITFLCFKLLLILQTFSCTICALGTAFLWASLYHSHRKLPTSQQSWLCHELDLGKAVKISLLVPNPNKIRSLNWLESCSNCVRSFKRKGRRGEVLKTKNTHTDNIFLKVMIRFYCFEVLVNHSPGGACVWAIKHGYIFKIRWGICFWILSAPSNDLWGISWAQQSLCVFCHCSYILCC